MSYREQNVSNARIPLLYVSLVEGATPEFLKVFELACQVNVTVAGMGVGSRAP